MERREEGRRGEKREGGRVKGWEEERGGKGGRG